MQALTAVFRDGRYRRSCLVLAAAATAHIVIQLIRLTLDWPIVRATWLAPKYPFMYLPAAFEIARFILQPALAWAALWVLFTLLAPFLPEEGRGT
jgi:hypothetical protein